MVYIWGSLGNNDIRSSPAEFLPFLASIMPSRFHAFTNKPLIILRFNFVALF